MEIPKQYDPALAEDKWYKYWMDNGFFKSVPNDKEPYTIVIPPPNVTGVLHMGHMLNNTIQDVLIRRARMQGKNACWVPGTDHASIATESKVVQKLANEGINKADLTREEFLKHAFEWKDKHGGIILSQLKKLGASCDWDRVGFTMDPNYSEKVIDTFLELYKKGNIYRGSRMVNWDPQAKTALSDEEVNFSEEQSNLYHIRYRIEGTDDWVIIATTRPETILGDSAICLHPQDERYLHLHGKKALVPLINKSIPIITDEYVTMDFGTGCLKVTPAHDQNDYELGKKHNLETVNIFNEDATLNENAQLYVGEDRFEVRKKIAKELQDKGFLVKTESHQNKVGRSERTNAIIEPRISMQWFCKMEEMAKPALEHVQNNDIQFYPKNQVNTYRHWMENIRDWCISRQLWWGHQIPAFFYGDGAEDYVVAKTAEEALPLAKEKTGNPALKEQDLKQDPDVLDTWFSSWIWPTGVFNTEEEKKYYYPTNALVTAPDIIFFWVARMIMIGYEQMGEKPFSHVYFTGLIRDKQGRKMSKTLGNSPDALELLKDYGADGVRSGLLLTAPAGNDLKFQDAEGPNGKKTYPLCEQGRNFSNKIWNAFRLVNMWEVSEIEQPIHAKLAIEWFTNKINQAGTEIEKHFEAYRISDALMGVYKLIWDDFCSWYLEIIKPAYQQPIDEVTYRATVAFYDTLLRLLHPFMPFVTEEIWQFLKERKEGESIMMAQWPAFKEVNENILNEFDAAAEVISQIRNIRKEKNIPNKEVLELFVKENQDISRVMEPVIKKLGNLSQMNLVEEKVPNAFSFMVKANEYFIPLGDTIDVEAEIKKLNEELKYTKGFLASVNKKLSNERFVNNAPAAVLEKERAKKDDAVEKIKIIEEKLAGLV